jgi:hypothetical protein
MAKKNQVYIDIVVDDKGTTKRVAVNAKKLGIELDKSAAATEKGAKGTDRLSKSQKDLDRNMRGTAKMSTNQTKEFSKMRQGMGGLVGTYATLAAQVFAVSAAFQFLQTASDYRNLIAGQEALGAVSGTAYKTITASIIQATDAQVKYADAARAAAIGSAAGLTSTQLTKLGEVAKNVSFALGRDLTDSFNRLVRGVTKAEPELLDELGIILRLETASEKYAQKLGVAASELTAFQRSQAVANEVLEQGERKYAAIQAMMDPDAAALQQFAKSFDDLANAFRKMVIEGLTPTLQFLSKNTLAFAASLALFALPIIKAIIPNLREWRKESAEVFKEHEANHEKWMGRTQEQSANLKLLQLDETKLKESVKETAKARGKDPTKGGMGYIAGATDDGRARAAAKKGLAQAEADLVKHSKVKEGIFKGYTAKEVAIARAAYNKRAKLAERHTMWLKRQWDKTVTHAQRAQAKIMTGWTSMWMGMQTVAAGAMTFINVLMSVAGIIGVLTMVAAGFVALYRWMNPLTEEAKRQAEALDELASKYKTLNEELIRARQAREQYTVGSMDATNIGQVLQSADVSKVAEDMAFLANSTERTGDKYKEFLANLKGTVNELIRTDKAFRPLLDMLAEAEGGPGKKGKAPELGAMKPMLKVSSDLMEIGSRISQLPEAFSKADKAFTSLSESMIKSNPLDTFLEAEKRALEGLQIKIDAATEKRDNLAAEVREQEGLANLQERMDQHTLDTLKKGSVLQRQAVQAWAAATEKQREEWRQAGEIDMGAINIGYGFGETERKVKVGMSSLAGRLSPEEIAALEARRQASHEEATEGGKILGERTEREKVLSKLRWDQVKAGTERLKVEIETIEQQTLGVTFAGKLHNLELQRVKGVHKVQLAEEAVTRAKSIQDTLKKGVDSIEDIRLAKEAVTQAELLLDKERASNNLANLKLDKKREEVELEKELLGIKIAAQTFEIAAMTKQNQLKLEEATGGGTFASQKRQRELRQGILEDRASQAAEDIKNAEKIFNEKVRANIKEASAPLSAAIGGRQVDPAVANMLFGDQARANAGLEAGNIEKAKKKKEGLDNEITGLKTIAEIKIETMKGTLQQAQAGFELVNVAEHMKETEMAILVMKRTGVNVTQEQIDEMRRLGNETKKVNQAKEDFETMKNSIHEGFKGAFEDIITGAKSAKEAFADMARGILQAMAQIMAKRMAAAAMSMIGMPVEKGGVPFPMAKGGYSLNKHNYSRGGTARGAQSGYAATLHGNEAVVPLPDNRSIPVTLNGAGGQNIVTINVAMDNSGNKSESSSDSRMGENLGQAISQAVQEELQYQKRSGGILNPYGVS